MTFTLTDDQRMLKDVVERFVADRYARASGASRRAYPSGFSPDNWALLAELGLLSVPFVGADGGLDGGPAEIAVVMEAIGLGLVAEPFLESIVIAGTLLAAAGSPAQKARWIPAILDGSRRLAFAHAEHGARFEIAGGGTTVTDGTLSGRKTFVAGGADGWIVSARCGDALTLHLVENGAAGVAVRDYRLVDGSTASEILFDAAPAEPLDADDTAVDTMLAIARIGACAEMIGIMGRMFDDTLGYVRERRQFGAPIGSFQAIQHRLADQYAMLELARSQLYRALLAPDDDRPVAIAAAKAFIARAAVRLGEEAIQLHGGMGVSDELMLGHAHKRLLLLSVLFGDADHEVRGYNRALRARG